MSARGQRSERENVESNRPTCERTRFVAEQAEQHGLDIMGSGTSSRQGQTFLGSISMFMFAISAPI